MKPIRLFTHADCEPPGYIATLLEKLGLPYQHICLDDGVEVPLALEDCCALIFMGGAGNVNEPTQWMTREIELIQQAHDQAMPMLGICLGAQLMSKALGGEVWQADKLEVGWHDVELLPSMIQHPWLNELPERFTVFQWHAHSFSAPPGMQTFATSDCTECQGFLSDRSLALQFHLEMTAEIIQKLIKQYASDIQNQSNCVQDDRCIMQDIESKCVETFAIADTLIARWLRSVHE